MAGRVGPCCSHSGQGNVITAQVHNISIGAVEPAEHLDNGLGSRAGRLRFDSCLLHEPSPFRNPGSFHIDEAVAK
ncbi:uncharacterized protein YALI1_E19723g [Yarrowia lipolytica]|uniref:Uncharacterized protein n=1 Tax=Yarrowia lipolytica TaxID=4952 RepID=A0A1D8NIN6_YARLL|nr:hypothetical protein YALI1_E19723g [Yarrowia lipolytica]